MKLQWIEWDGDPAIIDHRGRLLAFYKIVTMDRDPDFLKRLGDNGGTFMVLFDFEGNQVGDWFPVTDQDEAMLYAEEFWEENWEPIIRRLPPWRNEKGDFHWYFTPSG